MSETALAVENAEKPAARATPKRRRAASKGKQTRKTAKAKEDVKPSTDRTNKKTEVIALMKRAKGATLAEIIKETGWQPHTVRGFVSILGKTGEKIESSKSDAGERTYKIAK
jgi:hypothetical protein